MGNLTRVLSCPKCKGTGSLTLDVTDMGAIFKTLREIKGVTLREVEKTTGLSNAYISQFETGKIANPSFQAVSLLCEYYGITTSELTEGKKYFNLPPRKLHKNP